jgi:hypothetical protein
LPTATTQPTDEPTREETPSPTPTSTFVPVELPAPPGGGESSSNGAASWVLLNIAALIATVMAIVIAYRRIKK